MIGISGSFSLEQLNCFCILSASLEFSGFTWIRGIALKTNGLGFATGTVDSDLFYASAHAPSEVCPPIRQSLFLMVTTTSLFASSPFSVFSFSFVDAGYWLLIIGLINKFLFANIFASFLNPSPNSPFFSSMGAALKVKAKGFLPFYSSFASRSGRFELSCPAKTNLGRGPYSSSESPFMLYGNRRFALIMERVGLKSAISTFSLPSL